MSLGVVGTHIQKEVVLKKNTLFVIEKYIEDARQDEKHVLDLLESIMRPKLFVKEELGPISFKLTQIRSKITKNRVSTFLILEIQNSPAGGQCQPSH